MKKLLFVFIVLFPVVLFSQSIDYNDKGGYIAKGYDVVAYFSGTPKIGSSKYIQTYKGAKYKFSTKANLNKFKANPSKYIPQYGGYCAYAMGKDGSKVSINPKTFEIRNGNLYLFYNSYGTNTFNKWKKEGAAKLKTQADKNWKKVRFK